MKKILITGANGYIGSYLIEKFDKQEVEIIPLVRKLPPYFRYWKEKYEIIECDITQFDQLKEKIKDINYIIHLAAYNDILTKLHPDKALMVNGIGTRNMLEVAKEIKCELFVYFSTLQVYGKELEGIISVESPINAHNDYALTHYVAEQYCKMYSSNFNMNAIVLRPSNVFGAPMNINVNRWSLVPACFCKSAYETNKIVLKSSGKQMRDFIDLDLILQSVDFLINNYEKGFNIYNITSENIFSINEITKLVQSVAMLELNKNIDLIYESKFPLKSNIFKILNNLLGPVDKEIIEKKIIKEITKIFNLLKNG